MVVVVVLVLVAVVIPALGARVGLVLGVVAGRGLLPAALAAGAVMAT